MSGQQHFEHNGGDPRLPVVPCWLDGHAYLTVSTRMIEVCSAQRGEPLRRTPVCERSAVLRALESAQQALAGWAARSDEQRRAGLAAWSQEIEAYCGHLAGLLCEETGSEEAAARAALAQGAAALRSPAAGGAAAVTALSPAQPEAFAALLAAAAVALLAGGCLVVLSSPTAPSVFVAVAELATRAGVPAGVFNVLHGDDETRALLRQEGIALTVVVPATAGADYNSWR